MQKVNFNIGPQTPQFLADDILVDTQIKVNKQENGDIEKVAKVSLMAVDQQTKSINARVVLDHVTAGRLGEILVENMKKIRAELANKDLPKQPKPQGTDENYIN